MTTKADIAGWIERAKDKNSRWLLVVCDTFDYSDYPVFFTLEELVACIKRVEEAQRGDNMQRLMEVYDLSKPIEEQMAEKRAMHIPDMNYVDTLPNGHKAKEPAPVTEVQVWDGRG